MRHFKGHAKKSAEIAKVVLDRFNINNETKTTLLKLIELHSCSIDVDNININKNNVNFYKRLLKIQMCDAKGYEEEHSKKIIEQLNHIQKKLYL